VGWPETAGEGTPLSRLVPRFETVANLVEATNEVRGRVVLALDEYLELSARMEEFENAFSAQVLQAAQQLHEIIGQRKQLEAEYNRIRVTMDKGGYDSAEELADDVRAALVAAAGDDLDDEDAVLDAEDLADAEAEDEPGVDEDGIDAPTRKRILRDFKRIVLPAVHADTSDASFSVFEAAYSAYKARDYVVMEALVIRYRGEVTGHDDEGREIPREQATAWLTGYRAAAQRLDGRLRAIGRQITHSERDDPERTRQRMQQRSEQIRRAADEEAERLLELRRLLEELLGEPQDRRPADSRGEPEDRRPDDREPDDRRPDDSRGMD
jgi:hypothetical protein